MADPAMTISQAAFLNRLRSLFNIDADLLPELSEVQWAQFRGDAARYFIACGDREADAIWREVERRQTPEPDPRLGAVARAYARETFPLAEHLEDHMDAARREAARFLAMFDAAQRFPVPWRKRGE